MITTSTGGPLFLDPSTATADAHYIPPIQDMVQRPFDETQDFRDFMVWLCGFTDRGAPNQEEWEKLRERTKLVAAKFALQVRDYARNARVYASPQPITSGYASSGASSNVTYTTS